MFEISVKSRFSSAHHLKGYVGACQNPHGHNWEVEVFLRGTQLNKLGMLMDFGQIKAALGKILAGLDHRDLNRLKTFRRLNPTSEHLAKYIFDALNEVFAAETFWVQRVRISESPETSASYWRALAPAAVKPGAGGAAVR